MKKTPLLLFGLALLFLGTVSVHAQAPAPTPGGCINSPENPTAILAMVGSAGGFLFSRYRNK